MSPERALVQAYMRAMQAGAAGQDSLLELFHEDGEYVESFSGQARTHRGRAAIASWLADSWKFQPPDIAITIDRIDIDGPNLRVTWTCHSSAFVMPSRGVDSYHVRAGLIQRLETELTEPPTMPT